MRYDYSGYSLEEAADTEAAKKFIENIKQLDTNVAAARISILHRQLGPSCKVADFIARFACIGVDVKTSAD